jgi:hypothetical protein
VLRLTGHARDRLNDRGVSLDDLEYAYARRVGVPQPGSQAGTMTIVGPLPGGRGWVKIVVAGDDQTRVVSAWPIERNR